MEVYKWTMSSSEIIVSMGLPLTVQQTSFFVIQRSCSHTFTCYCSFKSRTCFSPFSSEKKKKTCIPRFWCTFTQTYTIQNEGLNYPIGNITSYCSSMFKSGTIIILVWWLEGRMYCPWLLHQCCEQQSTKPLWLLQTDFSISAVHQLPGNNSGKLCPPLLGHFVLFLLIPPPINICCWVRLQFSKGQLKNKYDILAVIHKSNTMGRMI